ncbi:MAG: hypothetical protein CMH55_07215, partial [Myxococcales bacterium]|nr:hypothetical protein [Myxococcales bacterium]
MIRLLIHALLCIGTSLAIAVMGFAVWKFVQPHELPTAELERLWAQGRDRLDRWQGAFDAAKGPRKRRFRQANKRSGVRVRSCGSPPSRVLFEQEGGVLFPMTSTQRMSGPIVLGFRQRLSGGPPRAVCLRAGRASDHRRAVMLLVISCSLIVGLLVFIAPLVMRLRRIEQAVSSLAQGDLSTPIHVEGRDVVGRLAEGLRSMTARLQALFEARKRFSDATSHELRTPLARIAAALDLMEQHPDPQLIDGMRADVREVNELVDELLLLGRLEDPQRRAMGEPVDLVTLLQERAAASARGGRLEPQLLLPGEGVSFAGDRRLLARLVDNLLSNAQRFARQRIQVELRAGADEISLFVTDDGPGVPIDLEDRLFEPFASGGEGSGLGL